MLVTDDFVFVHIPKTAGTFIQEVIRGHLPVLADWDYAHTPDSDLPDEWRHLPGFCVIRNPWDWYVSWFHYEIEEAPRRKPRRWDPGKRAVWEGAMRSGKATFKEAVVRACTGDFDHPLTALIQEQGIDLYSASVKTIAATALDRQDFTCSDLRASESNCWGSSANTPRRHESSRPRSATIRRYGPASTVPTRSTTTTSWPG